MLSNNHILQSLDNLQANPLSSGLTQALLSPLKAIWQTVLAEAVKTIQIQWQSEIYPNYRTNLANNYPFDFSSTDAGYEVVKQFFDFNQGFYWKFINQNLGGFLEKSGYQWQLVQWLGIGLPLSEEFMKSLQAAQSFSSLVFDNGGKFSYALYPIPEPHLSHIRLSTDISTYDYHNGPQIWTNLTWQVSQNGYSQLLIVRNDAEAQASIEETGLWSLFKIISKSMIQSTDQGDKLTWKLKFNDGRQANVSLLFKTNSSVNLLDICKNPLMLPAQIANKVS